MIFIIEPFSRSATYVYTAETCGLDSHGVVQLITSGFKNNFGSYAQRQKDYSHSLQIIEELMGEAGHKFLFYRSWFGKEAV